MRARTQPVKQMDTKMPESNSCPAHATVHQLRREHKSEAQTKQRTSRIMFFFLVSINRFSERRDKKKNTQMPFFALAEHSARYATWHDDSIIFPCCFSFSGRHYCFRLYFCLLVPLRLLSLSLSVPYKITNIWTVKCEHTKSGSDAAITRLHAREAIKIPTKQKKANNVLDSRFWISLPGTVHHTTNTARWVSM